MVASYCFLKNKKIRIQSQKVRRFKMAGNIHLIQFISQTRSVTPDFFFHLNIYFKFKKSIGRFKKKSTVDQIYYYYMLFFSFFKNWEVTEPDCDLN